MAEPPEEFQNGGKAGQNDPDLWAPGTRVYATMDGQMLARLDAYCRLANRSRASALLHLAAVALRRFEEEIDGPHTRPG